VADPLKLHNDSADRLHRHRRRQDNFSAAVKQRFFVAIEDVRIADIREQAEIDEEFTVVRLEVVDYKHLPGIFGELDMSPRPVIAFQYRGRAQVEPYLLLVPKKPVFIATIVS
jgi:hypothetical protein